MVNGITNAMPSGEKGTVQISTVHRNVVRSSKTWYTVSGNNTNCVTQVSVRKEHQQLYLFLQAPDGIIQVGGGWDGANSDGRRIINTIVPPGYKYAMSDAIDNPMGGYSWSGDVKEIIMSLNIV